MNAYAALMVIFALLVVSFIVDSRNQRGPEIAISVKEWTCTTTGKVTKLVPTPVIGAVMLLPRTETQCIQWTRTPE